MTPAATIRVALVGAGNIGVAWAVTFARAGYAVALHDVDPARLPLAAAEARAALDGLHRNELLSEPPETVAGRIRTFADLAEALADAVHVQESGAERLDLKQALVSRLDQLAAPDVVIASSTSAIAASRFAADLPGRARILVAHPANPPYLLPIVELVPAPFSAPAAVERTRELMAGAGMSPVVLARELEGFALNRLQGAVLREAYCLLRDGILTLDEIDMLVRDGLGRRWTLLGPFETVDLNHRGGIEGHAGTMGAAYHRMGLERGQGDPWTPELVAEATRQRRALLPLARWSERSAWRDRALMALERTRRSLEPFDLTGDEERMATPGRPGGALASTWAHASEVAAAALVREHYGREVTVTRLVGERDDVFRLETADGERLILKIAHPEEPQPVTNLVTAAMLHVARVAPDVPVERVVVTVEGGFEVRTRIDGVERSARLSTFLPGTIVREVETTAPLRRAIGAALAHLDVAMRDFRHPAADRLLTWDIARAHDLRVMLAGIEAPRDAALLSRNLDRFDAVVAPRLASLRHQAVHNDLGSDNLLVDPASGRITGIIDFGDMVWSALACDVAVAAAYQFSAGDDLLPGALDVIAGYHGVDPLTDEELDLMGDLLRTRMTIRIVIPEWRASRFPNNRAYILRNTERSWADLTRLDRVSPDELTARIRDACRPVGGAGE
jgi:L-gulonate 3-dehydrogenase